MASFNPQSAVGRSRRARTQPPVKDDSFVIKTGSRLAGYGCAHGDSTPALHDFPASEVKRRGTVRGGGSEAM